MKRAPRKWRAILKIVYVYPVAALATVFLAGIVFWGGFNWSLEITNTQSFCISCHVMRENIFEEYTTTTHYDNRTGVRASCPDCHVPREWTYKVARKILATNELFHWIKGTIDTPEKFEIQRPELARKVWASMEATDSRECRNCHSIGFMKHTEQTVTASVMHSLGEEWGKTCIDCHKGIAHRLPKDYDKNLVMDELHDRMEEKEVECRLCHQDIAGPPAGEEW